MKLLKATFFNRALLLICSYYITSINNRYPSIS